jgi:hypothetical protein
MGCVRLGGSQILFAESLAVLLNTCLLLYTPIVNLKNRKLYEVVVCLPAAASFQSQDKPAPSRKLNWAGCILVMHITKM